MSFPYASIFFVSGKSRLRNKLNDTTGLLDLALSLTADVASLDDEGNLGETALSEELGVSESEQVEDESAVGLGLLTEVLVAGLLGDEGPKLFQKLTGSDSGRIHFFARRVHLPSRC